MSILTILKMIYPTRKWLLSHIPIWVRGMMPAKQLMKTGKHVWGQKQLVLTQLTRRYGGKWILAGSITFTISTSCSKHTTVSVRNHMICFCVFYASNKFHDSNFFIKLQKCKITSTIFNYNFLKLKWVRFKIREMLLAISHG